jgi:phosphatidylethanolamine-binding protein (PEBP) family uncharacterized protein
MLCTPLLAHPGHSHGKSKSTSTASTPKSTAHVGTTTQNTEPAQGTFVMARDGVVQIRQADDTLRTLPLDSLSPEDQRFVAQRLQAIREVVQQPLLLAQGGLRGQRKEAAQKAPLIASHFDPFVKLKAIQTRWDDRYFYVESNGIPAHQMMVGITAWQQQVPIPQKYFGDNAWQIPLHPVPAKTPAMTRDRFLRGAIAVAVNGIPIFNPLNNRGDDAYLFGELDEFGGHCGRADDYHYHIAPVHLQETVGKDQPIAYALDGYPIFGYQDEKAPDFGPLDRLNGHKDAEGRYHYHATKTYPYLNGGFYGEVVEREGQVDPQPRAEPLRPALPPLRDAKITDFVEVRPGSYRLTYDVNGKSGTVSYVLGNEGAATFEFVDPQGRKTTETYTPRRRGPGGGPGGGEPGNKRPPRPGEGNPPPPRENRPPQEQQPEPRQEAPANESTSSTPSPRPQLQVTSTSIDDEGWLSVDCTCDGKKQSPAIAWKGAPAGTKAFAVSLWHTAPDQEKSYWVVYNIPAATTSLTQNGKPAGTVGVNDRRKAEFDPMCSKGPGAKTYHITVFALSQKIDLPGEQVTRAKLLEAIRDIKLAEGNLDFTYERAGDQR